MDDWICEICSQKFDSEVDLLAHQFRSNCEEELQTRRAVQHHVHTDEVTQTVGKELKIKPLSPTEPETPQKQPAQPLRRRARR